MFQKSEQNNRKRKPRLFCKCGILFQELNNAICQLQDRERNIFRFKLCIPSSRFAFTFLLLLISIYSQNGSDKSPCLGEILIMGSYEL